MLKWIRQRLAAPVFEDEAKTRTAGLLNTIALASLVFALALGIYYTLTVPGSSELPGIWLEAGIGALIVSVALFLMRRGHVHGASLLFSGLASALFVYLAYSNGGVRSPEYARLVLVPVIFGLLLGWRAGMVVAILTTAIGLGLVYAETQGLLPPYDVGSYQLLDLWTTQTGNLFIITVLFYLASKSLGESIERVRRQDRILLDTNRELDASRAALQARTQDLERRSGYLEVSAQIGRATSSILDTDKLIWPVVESIHERFRLYHVGLFMLDETGQWAEYRAGTGEAGKLLLEQGLRLQVGGRSMVGWCTANSQARVTLDVHADVQHLAHPLFPDTRSEAALPLIARGKVIGALSAQSNQAGFFDKDMVAVLQTIADQVAVAIDNTRLFQQAQQSLEAERRAYGELAQADWARLLRTGMTPGYRYLGRQVMPIIDNGSDAFDGSHTTASIEMPIKVRGQTIGTVDLRQDGREQPWTREEIALLETLTEQLGAALESARLYQDTQRRAAREQLIGEVTAHMRETLDLDAVLQTAARELHKTLNLAEVEVLMGTDLALDASESGVERADGSASYKK